MILYYIVLYIEYYVWCYISMVSNSLEIELGAEIFH